jgi:hypothetical protein
MSTDDDHLQRIEAVLARPELEAPALSQRICFRLWRRPARRAVSEAWVVVHNRDSQPLAREVRVDRNALAKGSPNAIVVRDAKLTLDTLESWMRELHAIRIPVGGVEEHMGLDGATYSLHVEAGWASADLRWWGNGPEEWSELIGWAHRTMTALRAHLE